MNRCARNRHLFSLFTFSIMWIACLVLVFVKYVRPASKYNAVYAEDGCNYTVGGITHSTPHGVNFSSEKLKWQHHENKSGFTSNISSQVRFVGYGKDRLYAYYKLVRAVHVFSRRNIDAFREAINKELGSNISTLLYLTKTNSEIGKQLEYYLTTDKKFEVTSSVYEKLPEDSIPDRINRCSVVGNSGVLLNSSCGKHIDESDFVYRCNAAPLGPFMEDAGMKSNITSFNPSIFSTRYHHISTIANYRDFLADMSQYNGLLWGSCLSIDVHTEVCLKAMKGYNITSNTFVLGHPDHFQSFSRFWENRDFRARMSTGFYLVTDALTRCNEIHLYGFWPFSFMFEEGSFRNAPYHYFDDVQFLTRSPHYMTAEFSLLLQLHTLGILKMHIGKC